MMQGKRSRTRTTLKLCLGAALLAWAFHGLARIEAPRASGARASMGYGPIAPPAVARRVAADVSARLVLDPSSTGPMIRVLEGDHLTLEVVNPTDADEARTVHLTNPRGEKVTIGPVAPGGQETFPFFAEAPGLYSFKSPSGEGSLFGLLLVEPLYGYRRADREFMITIDEKGTSVPAEASLAAEPGTTVRLFFGNAGADRVNLSFSGMIEDLFKADLGPPVPISATSEYGIAAGQSVVLELDLGEAGEVEFLAYVLNTETHRTVLRVEEMEVAEEDAAEAASGTADMTPEMKAKMMAGKGVFDKTCIACHQATGLGIPGVYPPLAQSDYLAADVDRAIHGVINGQEGEITVNGAKYNMLMPPQLLNDEEIAQVMTYVMNSWGNPGGDITVEQVKGVRDAGE